MFYIGQKVRCVENVPDYAKLGIVGDTYIITYVDTLMNHICIIPTDTSKETTTELCGGWRFVPAPPKPLSNLEDLL